GSPGREREPSRERAAYSLPGSGGMRKLSAGRGVATGRVASPVMARAAASPELPNLTVLSHPLIQHKLTILRDKRTSTRDFKLLVNEIAMLMPYKLPKNLPPNPSITEKPS